MIASSSDSDGTVLICGMGGRFGARVVRRLHRKRRLVGLGAHAANLLPPDVEHVAVDPLRSAARTVFARRDIGAIVYLGVGVQGHESREKRHSHSVLTFQRVLEYAQQNQVAKVVFVSSASNYGPRPDNAQYLTEQAPLLAGGTDSDMHTSVELDMVAQSCFWKCPEIDLVILRPVNILGTVHNGPSNYLRLPVVATLMGFDPMVQLVHQDDVAAAIELALAPGLRGVFNIAGPPPIALSKALEILERRTVSIPYTVAKGGLGGLFRMGLSKFVTPELDFLRYVCMVDDRAARERMGYQPSFDLLGTLRAVDDERWEG